MIGLRSSKRRELFSLDFQHDAACFLAPIAGAVHFSIYFFKPPLTPYSLNMRTIISVYRTLYKYVCAMDAEYAAELAASTSTSGTTPNGAPSSHPPESPKVDKHFRSGVYLGAGMSTLILSLLPARLLNIIELFGYAADRAEALELLGRAGGWGKPTPHPAFTSDDDGTHEDAGPTVSTEQEGVRRAICDMALLIFHLVLSSFTFDGVDTHMAARVVSWNLKRYPDGRSFPYAVDLLTRNVWLRRRVFPVWRGTAGTGALAAAEGD